MSPHPEHELLSALADGELTEREHIGLEAHLAGCGSCRATLQALRSTIGDLSSLDEPEMDPQASFAIRAALARERRLSKRSKRYAWVAGAAAASIVIVAFFAVSNRSSGSGAGGIDASAPQLYDDANYDETTVGAVLNALLGDRYAATRELSAAVEGGRMDLTPQPNGGAAGAEPAPAPAPPQTAPKSASLDSSRTDQFNAQAYSLSSFTNCVETVEASSSSTVRLIRSIAARFKGKDVFLLIFEAPAAKPQRLELWVLDAASCEVRFFAQAKIPR